ncbi:GntR family transcriptional regulator [Sodalis ligni]|uniref:GntR family transcriptional regulator n=1 Tax=Sodalis ligni TaxID=2697027 RepID=A0A4R1NGY6_9GAMM|nr:GntR family transcriptional regulator [Sodalis ligni]TCL06773.1 GntR family transcriptional regulator [Sodalis ligni]
MDFHLDRSSPLPLGVQLRGLIEYAITFGALKAGEKLPSVRVMAEMAGVAPMTVAQVYSELKEAELVFSKPGSGTFIADAKQSLPSGMPDSGLLYQRIDDLLECGIGMGHTVQELGQLVIGRFNDRQRNFSQKRVFLVGNFIASARDYAASVAETLGNSALVEATTVTDLKSDELLRRRAAAADLLLTFAHRRREVSHLLPGARVMNINLIPSENTRRALASLDPLTRVLVVSIFPEFTALMSEGVKRFAPHVDHITVIQRDDPSLAAQLPQADTVVYATGAEELAAGLKPGQQAFEYRHVPDTGDIQRVVLPLLQRDFGNALDSKEFNEN